MFGRLDVEDALDRHVAGELRVGAGRDADVLQRAAGGAVVGVGRVGLEDGGVDGGELRGGDDLDVVVVDRRHVAGAVDGAAGDLHGAEVGPAVAVIVVILADAQLAAGGAADRAAAHGDGGGAGLWRS